MGIASQFIVFLVAVFGTVVTPVSAVQKSHLTKDFQRQLEVRAKSTWAEIDNNNGDGRRPSRRIRRSTRRRYREHRRRGTIDIEFGGDQRKGGSKDVWRPELVKSLRCTSLTDCTECTTKSSCWHGLADSGDGRLEISITESMAKKYKYYGVEVFLACTTSGEDSELWLEAQELPSKAKLHFFVDGDHKRTMTEKQDWSDLQKFFTNLKGIARVILEVPESDSTQEALIEFDAREIDVITDNCMDMKECLHTLATGEDAAFAFRNNNAMQSQCLEGNKGSFSKDEEKACNAWEACLNEKAAGTKSALKAYLKVATSASLIKADQKAALENEHASSGDTACVNPEIDDPESLQCNCYETAQKTCQGEETEEVCLTRYMCSHKSVCTKWKKSHCPDSLIEQNASAEANQLMEIDWAAQRSLDSTLEGKCA